MKLPYDRAVHNMRTNPRSHWSPKKADLADETHAMQRIHDGFSDISAPVDFTVSRDSAFFCVGSCFARELEDAIDMLGLNALTRTNSLKMIEADPELFQRVEGVMGRPNAFLNRYNTGSMKDLMASTITNTDKNALLYNNGADKYNDYHFSRFFVALPEDEAKERRAKIINMYHEAAKQADVFVFTLGLCESFYDLESQAYLNITPDPRTVRERDIEFRFLTYQQNLDYVRNIISGIQSINPGATIVLTVSPVPLDVTFTGFDVVVANSLAKSTLLTAAHTIAAEVENCFYFPSYEIVTTSQQPRSWLWDRKHVAQPLVDHIMRLFTSNHIP